MSFVYLIESLKEDWVYVGSTNNLDERLAQHNRREVRSTKYRAPYKLIYFEEFDKISSARAREKEIKTSRFQKEKILALSSNG